MDVPVVRLLETIAAASGQDVAYTTGEDAGQRPSQRGRTRPGSREGDPQGCTMPCW
jgi:hypothetical protein